MLSIFDPVELTITDPSGFAILELERKKVFRKMESQIFWEHYISQDFVEIYYIPQGTQIATIKILETTNNGLPIFTTRACLEEPIFTIRPWYISAMENVFSTKNAEKLRGPILRASNIELSEFVFIRLSSHIKEYHSLSPSVKEFSYIIGFMVYKGNVISHDTPIPRSLV